MSLPKGGGGVGGVRDFHLLSSALYLLNLEILAILPGQVGRWQVGEGGGHVHLFVLCRAQGAVSCFPALVLLQL